jgi:hypothetical protein
MISSLSFSSKIIQKKKNGKKKRGENHDFKNGPHGARAGLLLHGARSSSRYYRSVGAILHG